MEDCKEKAEIELNVQMECMALLTSQLEKQKQYWEEKLQANTAELKSRNDELEKELASIKSNVRNDSTKEKQNFERKLKITVEKNVKMQKDLIAEREMNKNLVSSKIEMQSQLVRIVINK